MLLVVEQHFRKLNAPHLLAEVYAGIEYKDGACVVPNNTREQLRLTLVYTLLDKTCLRVGAAAGRPGWRRPADILILPRSCIVIILELA